jgi:hypothetical protein
MPENKWARLLAYVTGLVNQKLLLQNEYLAAENRILRAHLPVRVRLSNPERSTLAEIAKCPLSEIRSHLDDRSLTVGAPIGAMSVSEWLCGIRDRTSEMTY